MMRDLDKFRWAIFIFCMLTMLQSRAQDLYFNYSDGSDSTYSISQIRKITFSGDLMSLNFLDGSVLSWNVSTINDNQFSLSILSLDNSAQVSESPLIIFPNPVADELTVSFQPLTPDDLILNVYDLNGRLLIEKCFVETVTNKLVTTVNVSNLERGYYLLRIKGKKQEITKEIFKN